MICSKCGSANSEGPEVRYCRQCGWQMAPAGEAPALAEPPAAPTIPLLSPDGGAALALPGVTPPTAAQASVNCYGGFWIRLVAWVVDWIVIFAIVVLAGAALGVTIGLLAEGTGRDPELSERLLDTLVGALYYAVLIAYRVCFPPLLGATPGKLLFGYHIVDRDSRHISFKRSIVRFMASVFPSGFFMVGYVAIAGHEYKQGWHDQIARTFVVRKEFVEAQGDRSRR